MSNYNSGEEQGKKPAFEVKVTNHVPGRGILLWNSGRTNEKQPNFKGYIQLLSGEIVRLGMWEKVGKTGHKFYTLAVDTYVPREEPQESTKEAKPKELDTFGSESDIPW